MSEILKQANEARLRERTELLGEHALSVHSALVSHIAPKGFDVLHIAGHDAPRIDERGSVHFKPPVRAVVQEKSTMVGARSPHSVVELDIPREIMERGLNGDAFVPLITEKDSKLHEAFRAFFAAGETGDVPEMTEAERAQWDKWVSLERYRLSQPPVYLTKTGE